MNLRVIFNQVYSLIHPHLHLINSEILPYKYQLDQLIHKDFRSWSSKISEEELLNFEKHFEFHFLKESKQFYDFLNKINELQNEIQSIQNLQYKNNELINEIKKNINSHLLLHVSEKKCHEIFNVIHYLQNKLSSLQDLNIFDFCSGQGKLSRIISNYFNVKVKSFDYDLNLQTKGQQRSQIHQKHHFNEVEFIKFDLVYDSFEKIDMNNELKTLSLGLHTCGVLAQRHLKIATDLNHKYILNFGCCYFKTLKKSSNYEFMSEYFKNNFKGTIHSNALTLASRAHFHLKEKDLLFKQRVKYYRYTLDFLLNEKFKIKNQVVLGSSLPKHYKNSFYEYCKIQFKKLHIDFAMSEHEVMAFYENNLEKVKELLFCGLIRNKFGYFIELLVQLDRALYLEEKGYKVEIINLFDPAISPRSHGIFAQK